MNWIWLIGDCIDELIILRRLQIVVEIWQQTLKLISSFVVGWKTIPAWGITNQGHWERSYNNKNLYHDLYITSQKTKIIEKHHDGAILSFYETNTEKYNILHQRDTSTRNIEDQ